MPSRTPKTPHVPPSGADELYPVESVALLAHVSQKLIREEIKRGKLGVVRIGRVMRVPRSELERWLRPSTNTPAPASLRSGARPLA